MNAVARVALAENNFIRGVSFSFDLPEFKILVLIFFLLISALGVVYVKDFNRRLFITSNNLEKQTQQLKLESNRLLLEQSSWGSQSRVQIVAQQQLEMRIPKSGDVIMVKV